MNKLINSHGVVSKIKDIDGVICLIFYFDYLDDHIRYYVIIRGLNDIMDTLGFNFDVMDKETFYYFFKGKTKIKNYN